jgi:putative DNA primase/helicase
MTSAMPLDQFRHAMLARDILPPVEIIADGKIHRCDVEGKHGKNDASYVFHIDGVPAGGFENHRDGLGWETWKLARRLNDRQPSVNWAKVEADRAIRDAANTKTKEEAAELAADLCRTAKRAPDDHPYHFKKRIKSGGARLHFDLLVIPVYIDGKITSVQFISPEGKKWFMKDGRVGGGYFPIGSIKGATALCICEGYATGCTIHEATGHPVAVAFFADNLLAAATALRRKFPTMKIILCADDDYLTPGNPGVTKANQAALAIGGLVAIPKFGDSRKEEMTDFNDLMWS